MEGLREPGVKLGRVGTPGPARDVASLGCPSRGTRLSLDKDKQEALSAAAAECAQDTWAFFSPETNAEETVSAQLGLDGGQISVEHRGSAFWGPGTDRLAAPEAAFALRSVLPAPSCCWKWEPLPAPRSEMGLLPAPQAKFSRKPGLGSPRGVSGRLLFAGNLTSQRLGRVCCRLRLWLWA